MIILAGSARGRALKTPPNSPHVRPILARIKKSVFDIIRHRLPNANFLDLYAGTGSVGLEALSRGAARCTFVENDPRSLKYLKMNIDWLKFTDQSTILRLDASGALGPLQGPYNVIFMGPPYVDAEKNMLALTIPTLQAIKNNHLLLPDGLIVAQHHKKEAMDMSTCPFFRKRQERYGDTLVSFLVHPA